MRRDAGIHSGGEPFDPRLVPHAQGWQGDPRGAAGPGAGPGAGQAAGEGDPAGPPRGPVVLAVVVWVVTTVAAGLLLLVPRERLQMVFTTPFPAEARPTPDMFASVHLAGLLVCMPIGVLIYVVAPAVSGRLQYDPEQRRRLRTAGRCVAVAVASGTPVLPLMLIVIANPPGLMLAVPGAVYAIWVLHRLQRHRRLPVPVSLAAFGWGATFAMTIGLLLQSFHNVAALAYLSDLVMPTFRPDLDEVFTDQPFATEISAPLWEEVGKATGVVLIFNMVRRRYDGLVHGIVIGAMVGAGFNFIETVRFAHTAFELAMTQVYARQWASGFVFGHTLFTALVGAAVALGYRHAGRVRRALIPAVGFGLAVLGHFLWNDLSTDLPWQSDDPAVDLYAAMPLNYLTISGLFLLIVVALLWLGLCREAAALRGVLPVEAITGYDAITPEEAVMLINPNRRLGARLRAIRSLGPAAYFRVARLHAAQLDLAMERWRLGHEPGRVPPENEAQLRERVFRRRQALVRRPQAVRG